MLAHLNINGLAIIDELSINFSDGFNVITGETGAGKSILIKALDLILGGKATADVVRSGSVSATVCGNFQISVTHPAIVMAKELGLVAEDSEGSCDLLIRRSISTKGRSSAWINDTPVTLTALKKISVTLVDIFGQHENTKVLDVSRHTYYLDQFLSDRSLSTDVRIFYRNALGRLRDLRKFVVGVEERQRTQDYLRFRFEELSSMNPSEEDYLSLQESCRSAGQAMEVKNHLVAAQRNVDSGAEGSSISSLVWATAAELQKISELSEQGKQVKDLAEKAEGIATDLDDLSFSVDRFSSSLSFDESELEANQMRLAKYQDFFRKLGVSDISALLLERDRLEQELATLDSASDTVMSELDVLATELSFLKTKSKKLSKERALASVFIKERVEAEFSDLAMPNAKFDVELQPCQTQLEGFDLSLFGAEAEKKWIEISEALVELSEVGYEKAAFFLASNPGEASLPLQKIASGGEISRIMLALKKALVAGANTCILVFDEIDSGISGRVATMVGKKMQHLAEDFQIVCISHLPQVASFADSHFLVHKFGNKDRTESTISKLSSDQSTREIARLLSGDQVDKLSLANAESLQEKAKRKTKENTVS